MAAANVSVIGADRVPLGYFRSKLAAEEAVADSGLPFTTLRAAQFHDFVLMVAQKMAKLPVLPIPSAIRFQPVDADQVAARLVKLTLAEPAGHVPDLAGPKVYGMADLIRRLRLTALDERRLSIQFLDGAAVVLPAGECLRVASRRLGGK